MAHVGQKGRLGGGGGLGVGARFLQLRFEQGLLRHIADDVDELEGLAVVVQDQDGIGLHPDPVTLLVAGAISHRLVQPRLAPLDHPHDRLADGRQVIGMAHVHRRELEVFFDRVAEHPLAGGRQVHDLAFRLDA